MSYKIEVITDSSGKWTGNQLCFASREEAEAYAVDLAGRWLAVKQCRIVESEEQPTHKFVIKSSPHRIEFLS